MKDEELAAQALHYWANYIETGAIMLSAKDVQERSNAGVSCMKLKALDVPQHKRVVRLRELAFDLTNGGKAVCVSLNRG